MVQIFIVHNPKHFFLFFIKGDIYSPYNYHVDPETRPEEKIQINRKLMGENHKVI